MRLGCHWTRNISRSYGESGYPLGERVWSTLRWAQQEMVVRIGQMGRKIGVVVSKIDFISVKIDMRLPIRTLKTLSKSSR